MNKVRLALIGTGRWGQNIQKTVALLPDAELAYTATLDWRTLLDKTDIDGVLIATPPSTHAEIALAFLEHGVPVFVEKPMTDSLAEAQRLAAAAHDRVLVGHIHLYNPAYQQVRELLPQLGAVRLMVSEGANNGPYRDDYSALWDWAPHDISMMADLLGMPQQVAAWGAAILRPGTNLYDTSYIKLDFAGGAVGIITSSWLMPQKRKKLTIVGATSSVVYDDTLPEHKVTLFADMGPTVVGGVVTRQEPAVSYPPYAADMPLTLEVEAFVRMIRTKEKPRSDVALGLKVVQILDAAERSIAAGGTPVPLI